MSTGAVIVMIVSTILTWVGIFFGARALMRRLRRHHEEQAHISNPIERAGFRFEFARLVLPGHDNHVAEFVECSVTVPALGDLSLADGDARHQRTQVLVPRATIGEVARIDTDDDVFDGLFGWSAIPSKHAERLVANPAVRHVLSELREGFGGLWVDRGRIRVVEKERPGPEEIDVMVEFLVSQLALLPPESGAQRDVDRAP